MKAPNPRILIPLYLQNCSFMYSHVALHITKSWLFGSNDLKDGEVLSQGSRCLPGNRDLFFNILNNEYYKKVLFTIPLHFRYSFFLIFKL